MLLSHLLFSIYSDRLTKVLPANNFDRSACLSPTLKMEAIHSFETVADFHLTTRPHITEDNTSYPTLRGPQIQSRRLHIHPIWPVTVAARSKA
jgi:hypothetical protein